MKVSLIYALLLIIATTFSVLVNGQSESSADSLQRRLMRDSLKVSDAAITKVFTIRNNFLTTSAQITAVNTLTEAQKNSALRALASQTNAVIQNTLGGAAYDQYTQMIRRRMINKYGTNKSRPLASGGN